MAKKHASSGGMFVRLKDHGDKVVGAFCGEPYAREVVWTGQGYEEYDREIHGDGGASLRVTLNFYVPSEHKMKIVEGGTEWFNGLLKVQEKYGLSEWLFEIERNGAAKDPKTKYSILPEARLSDDQKAEIERLELHDLEAIANGTKPPASPEPAADGPMAEELVRALTERLKALPEADLEVFLRGLQVSRVREIRNSQAEKALTLLAKLEASQAKAPAEAVNPFE